MKTRRKLVEHSKFEFYFKKGKKGKLLKKKRSLLKNKTVMHQFFKAAFSILTTT